MQDLLTIPCAYEPEAAKPKMAVYIACVISEPAFSFVSLFKKIFDWMSVLGGGCCLHSFVAGNLQGSARNLYCAFLLNVRWDFPVEGVVE